MPQRDDMTAVVVKTEPAAPVEVLVRSVDTAGWASAECCDRER